jgi:hypothetical protein
MSNKRDLELLVEQIIEHGFHLVKFEELADAYNIARSRWNSPIYCNAISANDVAKEMIKAFREG